MTRPSILGLALLFGCSGSSGDQENVFELRFEAPTEDMGCPSSSCLDYPIGCGASLHVQWRDRETGDLALNNSGEPLTACVDVSPAPDLCSVGTQESNVEFRLIPPGEYSIQVALWEPGVGCPAIEFDIRGKPIPSIPSPAFAGASYVDTRTTSGVEITMSCSDPNRLNDQLCIAVGAAIEARVFDIDSLLFTTRDEAELLAVAATKPRPTLNSNDEVVTELDIASSVPLILQSSEPPFFLGQSDEATEDMMCASVLEQTAETTTSAQCQQTTPGALLLSLPATWVPKEITQAILSSLAIDFPESGLVLGRVVDAAGSPAAGAVVSAPNSTVLYWDESRTAFIGGGTSGNGFFVSLDSPFASSWTASHPDGRRQQTAVSAGLIQNVVTPIVLRLDRGALESSLPPQ